RPYRESLVPKDRLQTNIRQSQYLSVRLIKVFSAYQRAGVENSKLMVIRNMSHSNPKNKHFEKAIEFLDAPGSE
ncbi:MAG: hypothetical protein V3V96_12960, partial [Acidiferrobacterales bacterium]